MSTLDREQYDKFFKLDREAQEPMTTQEEKDHIANAKVLFANPIFQELMKSFHALEFSRLTEAIGRDAFTEAQKHKAALDMLSTLYEHVRSVSEDEGAYTTVNSTHVDDPYGQRN